MINRALIALLCALVGGISLGDEVGTQVGAHVLARLGDNALKEGGERQLFIYSKEKLSQVQYRVGNAVNWDCMVSASDTDGYFVYVTTAYQKSDAGKVFHVRGVRADSILVTDRLEVAATEEKTMVIVSGESEEKYVAPQPVVSAPVQQPNYQQAQPQYQGQDSSAANLDQRSVYYGSSNVDAQSLAQARANAMANGAGMTHLGGGIVQTSRGTLAEGIGWSSGGGTPNTCTATNGTAAVADAVATGPNGTYRVRLYDSPGTTNGGGGGWRRR